MKGIAYQKLGNLAESRKCIGLYSDLSWITDVDQEAAVEVEYYRNIAIANTFVIDLLEGKVEVLLIMLNSFVQGTRRNCLPA